MNERIEELMSIICEGQNSIQREEIENYINNLQSEIDKANKILDKHFQDDEGIVYKITGEHVAERNEKFIEELRYILKEKI